MQQREASMNTTKLDKVRYFRCLAVVVAIVMLSLGSAEPAASSWRDCQPGYINCDAGCMPTVNHCCGTGRGEHCRDTCWIGNAGAFCCERYLQGTADGRCVPYTYSAKPARLPGEKEGERSSATPVPPTAPEIAVPPQKN